MGVKEVGQKRDMINSSLKSTYKGGWLSVMKYIYHPRPFSQIE